MDHAPTDQPIIQPSLMEEPACSVSLRAELQRGEPYTTCSFTITRPDDSWLACLVRTTTTGPEAIRSTMASLMHQALKEAFSLMGPF